MVFSSIPFLYYFLPLVLLIYYLVPKKGKNLVLLIFSCVFYFYGEPKYIWLLLFSCVANYFFGRQIEKSKEIKKNTRAKGYFILALFVNLGFLFYFKYFGFLLENIQGFLHFKLSLWEIVLPIGISFFTFQALSYIIDIYLGKTKSARHLLTFATYLCLFPQLVAGPIVRYVDVERELVNRDHTFDQFSKGVARFVIGLSKKVLLANMLGEMVQSLTTVDTILSYWLQALGTTFQIYFDFSGYSDMAIGLGLFFGFHFLENFRYPLIASSITDFWRRWHISLSSWLKDYVYIPLGGSRKGELKTYRNIFIVWATTGLWHGASWNFVLWGVYFAFFLMIEKRWLLKRWEKHRCLGTIFTFFLVMISFVIFHHENLSELSLVLQKMFGMSKIPIFDLSTIYYLRNYLGLLVLAALASTPLWKQLILKLQKTSLGRNMVAVLEPVGYIALLLLSTAFIVDSSFNPFLYFRF